MRKFILLLIISGLVIYGCQKEPRDWNNLFDPQDGQGGLSAGINNTNVVITTNIIYYSDGVISTDTVWDRDVVLNTPIIVLNGATLTIQEGIDIQIALPEDDIFLTIYGTLIANSTVRTGIRFIYLNGLKSSQQKGIRIYNNASILIKNCKINSDINIIGTSTDTNYITNIIFISNRISAATTAAAIYCKNIIIKNSRFIANNIELAGRMLNYVGSTYAKVIYSDIIGNNNLALYDIPILSNNYIADNNGYVGVTLSANTPNDSNV